MSKHKITRKQYETYKRTHDYDDPLAEEMAKVRREKDRYAEYARRAKGEMRHLLREMTWEEDAEEDDGWEALEFRARREIRNARTHKERRKGLAAHEGEDERHG